MNDLLGWNDYKQTEHQEPLALLVHNREARLILDNQIQNIANRIQSKSSCPLNENSSRLSNTQLQSCDKQMRSASNNRNSNSSFNGSPSRSLNNSPLSGIAENDMDSSDSETMKLTRIKELRRNGLSPNRDEQLSNSSRGSTPPSEVGAFWSTLSTPSTLAEAPEVVLCYWCKRVCEGEGALSESDYSRGNIPFTNGESHFCSEVCFNQCRRASFKKSKICDWCRLVKPTVSYVDFTDGDHQLQFCSDKCLNQYKMQIFCRETEAHLQLHPHISSLAVGSHVGALITPDLWLKDCNASNSSKKEAMDDEERNKSTSQVSSDLRQPHSAGFGTESQLSISDSSSPLSFDDCEPVNLSTTQHQSDYADSSRQGRKTSPVSMRTRSSKQSDDSNRLGSPRYGRPKTREVKEFRETIADNCNLKRGKSPLENIDVTSESKPKGTIRVRQLEEQPCPSKLDTPANSSSSSPTSSKTIVPGFSSFGGLLLGARQPLLQGLPSILPSVSHSAIPRPQILPQLLLSHPDFLRYHGLRQPFFLAQPPLQPLSQQPPPAIPTPLPSIPPPPQTTLPNPLGFPPVTVLLPLPLPIPIPIPIPIPFPIPVNSGKCSCGTFLKKTTSGNDSSETSSTSSLKQSIDKKIPDSSTIIYPLTIKLKKQKLTDIDSQKTNIKSIPSNKDRTELPIVQSDLSKLDRKERRSILKYTSDVYEINGVFVPREGGWNTLSKPVLPLPIKDKESDGGSTCPVSPMSSNSNAQGIVDKEERCSSSKKRPHNSKNNDPVPKKKNLLT